MLHLHNYPHVASSTFGGRRVGHFQIEQIRRRSSSQSSASDYIAVVRNINTNVTFLVPYHKIVSAFRSASPTHATATLQLEYVNWVRENTVAAAQDEPVAVKVNTTTAAPSLSAISADGALEAMTLLVRAARKDPQVAKVVKTLAELI